METRKLYRSKNNRMIAGVCGGLGDYFNIDPTLAAVSATTIYVAILVVVAIDLTVGIERATLNSATDERAR